MSKSQHTKPLAIMILFRSITITFALLFLSTICCLAQRYTTDTTHSSYIKYLSAEPGQRVTLMDQGLQMPIGSGAIPEGWQLIQDIATNPNTGIYDRYRHEIRGNQAELMASFAPTVFFPAIGKDLQQNVQQTVLKGLAGELTDLKLGTFHKSEYLENNSQFQEMALQTSLEGIEASISGTCHGQTVSGIVHVILMKPPQEHGTVLYTTSVVISPVHLLPQTLKTAERIRNSFQPNPKWQERVQQILQEPVKRMRNSEPDPSYFDHDTTYYYQDTTYFFDDTATLYNPNDYDSLPDDWHPIAPNYDSIENLRMTEENGWKRDPINNDFYKIDSSRKVRIKLYTLIW